MIRITLLESVFDSDGRVLQLPVRKTILYCHRSLMNAKNSI
jgi:hypothetical protein